MIFLISCGGGGGSTSGGPTGQLSLSLTDSAECNFDSVYVTVQKVRVHQSASAGHNDAGWIDIAPPGGPVKVDLLSLQNGGMQDLGLGSLPVAHYTQVRLYLTPNTGASNPANDNNYVVVGGTPYPLDIPSGFQNGIKFKPTFDIAAGQKEEMILDIDPCQSIALAKDGTYHFRPRALFLRKAEAGHIAGTVSQPTSYAVVKAEINGYVYRQTRVRPDGSFDLYPLPNSNIIKSLFPIADPAGTFDVVIVSDNYSTVVTTGVPVTEGGTTVLSTTGQKTLLTPSTPGTLTGHIDPTSADARIRQTINTKPYQIRRHPVDLVDGSYTFTLSTGAPQFGAYGTGALPISYSSDTGAAANYTIDTPNDDGLYKVASQSTNVLTPQTVDFTSTGAGSLLPVIGTAGSATGSLNVTVPGGFVSGTILLSVRSTDDFENVNSTGVPVTTSGSYPFTIDDLAPGTYTLTIVSAKGFATISPAVYPVTIPVTGGTVSNNNFTVAP